MDDSFSSDHRSTLSEDSEATDTDPEQEQLLHCAERVTSGQVLLLLL